MRDMMSVENFKWRTIENWIQAHIAQHDHHFFFEKYIIKKWSAISLLSALQKLKINIMF